MVVGEVLGHRLRGIYSKFIRGKSTNIGGGEVGKFISYILYI